MPKFELKQKTKKAIIEKARIKSYLNSKYFSLFMNQYEWGGLNEQQSRFLLTQFWERGRIWAFILPESKTEEVEGELILTPFNETLTKNIYNYPTGVIPVNNRGASFIPNQVMKVNQDGVIGWAHSSHNSVYSIVDYYTDRLTEVESCIDMNLFTHKLPRLIVCSPEDKERVERIMRDIDEGNKRIFLDSEDTKAISNVLSSGESYIIDKLYTYKESLENELLTLLGIDNKGVNKKERLIVDEVNANNEIINEGADCFLDEMKIFCNKVKEVLGYTISVKSKMSVVKAVSEENKEDEEDDSREDL